MSLSTASRNRIKRINAANLDYLPSIDQGFDPHIWTNIDVIHGITSKLYKHLRAHHPSGSWMLTTVDRANQ